MPLKLGACCPRNALCSSRKAHTVSLLPLTLIMEIHIFKLGQDVYVNHMPKTCKPQKFDQGVNLLTEVVDIDCKQYTG